MNKILSIAPYVWLSTGLVIVLVSFLKNEFISKNGNLIIRIFGVISLIFSIIILLNEM